MTDKRILVVHTGGTIGMVQTADGFAPQLGVVEEALVALAQKGEAPSGVSVHLLEPLIDSAQASPHDWLRIARAVHENRGQFDGFVVTHGTDTLAYSAGALCLALAGLDQPVILTGAMLPLSVEGSDGWRNLTDGLRAAQNAPAGVWVQFAGRLLHGGRVRKSHSSAMDAFEAGAGTAAPRLTGTTPSLLSVAPHKVGVFSVTPGPCVDLLDYAVTQCDALLLRCYGSGTAPDSPEMRAALQKAQARGMPILAVSQCPEGGMRLGTYAAGRVLRRNGVIDGRDITPEMAYVKLQYALSLAKGYDAQRSYLAQSWCGEFTEGD